MTTTPTRSGYSAYGDQFAAFYDAVFPREAIGPEELAWLRQVLPRRTRRLAELGVGTGRVALPLAESLGDDDGPVEYLGVDGARQERRRSAGFREAGGLNSAVRALIAAGNDGDHQEAGCGDPRSSARATRRSDVTPQLGLRTSDPFRSQRCAVAGAGVARR